MTDSPSRPALRLPLIVLGLLGLCVAMLSIGATTAMAAGGSAEISIVRTNGSPQNSGAASQYQINFSCSGVEAATCGEHPTIRIPLDLTSSLPDTPAMSGWDFRATSGIAGLIESEAVEGGELVIRLDPTKLVSGESDTIQLSVTPPNGTTPNGTSWSLTPSFETDDIPVVAAPDEATGEAVATPQLAVSKTTLDGGAVYVRGHEVTFNITARCAPGASTGKLFMTSGSLVDQLPAGLEYVSATPAPSKAPAVGASGEIVWSYPDGASLPPGCGEGSNGTAGYQVIARVPATGTDHQQVENDAIFSGTPIDEASTSTEAPLPLTLINEPPEPGELGTDFLGKVSQAPICIEGAEKLADRSDCYAGTYPGNWITPVNPSPSLNPGAVEGRFEVTINYPASRAYETDLVDPMPCLEEGSEGEYSSRPISGEVGSGTIPTCAEPAFNPTAILVSAPSLGAAIGEGWQPLAILTDGTSVALSAGANGNGGTYFDIPVADLGRVAAIELPPNPSLTDNHLSMNVFGYADGSLEGGDVLHDVAVASAYPIGETTAASTSRDAANIYIEPTVVQLGIRKTFGGLSSVNGGKSQQTTMNLVGSLTVPPGKTLPGDVVLADLLPEGMTWSNQAASGAFTVSRGLGSSQAVTATVTVDPNYEESGRELIRVTLPKAAFEEAAGGFYTIKPPSGFFRMQVPNETSTFVNDADLFVLGVGRETQPVCGGGEGTGSAEFQSKDERDLAGNGEEEQNFCQSTVELKVNATGGPNFALKKFVQGNLDPQRKGALGIGQASRDGTGIFTLVWANNGSAPLAKPVIYDILPFVGDTGVDEGQSGNPRNSEFATEFVEVLDAGALPAGVSVEYSTSTNPCRPEVNPAATGCSEDWTPTVPGDPATVKSLKFTSTENYAPGDSFSLEVKVKLPHADVNDVAWNSAATDAETTAGLKLAPAEPPKVGITAPAPLIQPTVSTAVSEAAILPEREVHDSITVGNTEERAGEVEWKLHGPVAAAEGSCTGLNWAGSPVVDQGTLPIADDETVTTPPTKLTTLGCYAYETTVNGSGFEPSTSPAGTAGELVLVHPATPSLETTVSAASVLPETTITDSVGIVGTSEFEGTVKWTLFGPVAPRGGSCEGLDWSGAPTFDEGQFTTTADGTGTTAPSVPSAHGCYGYEATIEGTNLATFTSPVGSPGEMVLVHPATPTVTTRVSAASVLPGATVADSIAIAGTAGFEGRLAWRLAGPVGPAADGTCEGLDWSGAATVAEGDAEVAADGTQATAATELTAHGCYGFEATVEGEHLSTVISPLGSAGETVLVHPAKATLATRATADADGPGAEATDLITVGGTSGFAGTVHWRLAGPVAPAADGSCNGLNWGGAGTVAQGDFPVAGDGQKGTPSTALTAAGCYGYEVALAGPHLASVVSPLGGAGETVLIKAPPAAGKADLRIVKRVAESKVRVGKPLHYTIEVQNKGTAPATDTVVNDTPRSPLGFVSAKASQGHCGKAFPLHCKLGTLAPGATAKVKVVARPLVGGKIVNGATVTSPDDPAARGSKAARAAASSRSLIPLRLRKKVTPRTVEAGGKLHYAIVVSNPTAVTAHALVVCDRLPAGLVYVSSSRRAKLDHGRYCWKVAALKGHAHKKIRVVARALKGAGGRLVNRATLVSRDGVRRKAAATVRVVPRPVPAGGVTG